MLFVDNPWITKITPKNDTLTTTIARVQELIDNTTQWIQQIDHRIGLVQREQRSAKHSVNAAIEAGNRGKACAEMCRVRILRNEELRLQRKIDEAIRTAVMHQWRLEELIRQRETSHS